jgi:hypothetical protein
MENPKKVWISVRRNWWTIPTKFGVALGGIREEFKLIAEDIGFFLFVFYLQFSSSSCLNSPLSLLLFLLASSFFFIYSFLPLLV